MPTRDRFWDVSAPLLGDATLALAQLEGQDSPFNRRLWVRTICSYFEGDTFARKRDALELARDHSVPLGRGEVALIEEERALLSDAGEATFSDLHLPFIANVRFSLRVMASVASVRWELPREDVGWQHLRDTYKVRSRLTHPRALAALTVTDEELRNAKLAFGFYRSLANSLLAAMARELLELRDQARTFLREHRAGVPPEVLARLLALLPESYTAPGND